MFIQSVVFDLDGTLISSHKSIYGAMIRAFDMLNIRHNIPEDKFENTIGMHFPDIFEIFGVVVPDFEKFIEIYKSVYFDFIGLSKIYPGVEETIGLLKKNNIRVALLTTKMQDQADKILNHFRLADGFDYIMGRRPGIARKPSAEPLLKICGELNILPENTLMVGDSEMDIQCGKNAGAKTCAVTFGYRPARDLILQHPDFMIDNFDEIRYILNGKRN